MNTHTHMLQKQQHRQEESVRCLEITLKYLAVATTVVLTQPPPSPHIHTLTSRQAGGLLGLMKKKSGVMLWRFSVLRCSPSNRGRRKRMPSSAFDSAVIGISISICRSSSERSCEGFQPGRLPLSPRCICLLELACPCQAIVVNVSLTWQLSAGTGPICHLGRCRVHLQKAAAIIQRRWAGLAGCVAEITGRRLCPA